MSSNWWERLTQPAFSEEQQAELRSKEYQDKMRQFSKAYDDAGAMPSYYRAKKAAEATYGPNAGQVMSQVQQDIFSGLDQASMTLHRLATEPMKAALIAADIAFKDSGKYFMNLPAGIKLLKDSYELAQGDRTNKGFFESGENPVTLGQAFAGLFSRDNPDWNDQEAVDRYFESGGAGTLTSGFIDSLSVMFLDPFNYVSPSKGLTKAFNKLGVGTTSDFIQGLTKTPSSGKLPGDIADALDHVESILNNNPSIIPYGDDRYIEASNILYHLFDDYSIISNRLPEENIRPLNAADFDTEPRYFTVDADPWAVADGVIFNWDYGKGRWKVARTFPAITLSKIVDSASGSVERTRGLIDYEDMFPDDFGDSPAHLQMIVRRGTVDAPPGFDVGYGQTVRRGDAEYEVRNNPFSDTPIIDPSSGEIRPGNAGFFPETTTFSVLHVPVDGTVRRVVVAFDRRNRKYYALQSYTSTFRSKIDQQGNLEEAEFQGVLDAEAEEMANLVNTQRNEQMLDEGTIDADYLRDQDIDNLDNWVSQDEINDFAADNLFSVEDAPRGAAARATGGTTVRQSKRKLAWTPLDNFDLSVVKAYEVAYVNPVTGKVSKVSVPANFAPTKVVDQSAPGEAVDTHAFFDSLPVFVDATKTKKGAFSIDVDGKVVPIAEASRSWSAFRDAIAESRLRVAELDERWYNQRVQESRVKPEMTPEQIEQYRSTWRARGEQTAAELAASLPKLNGKVDIKRLEDMYADTLKLNAEPLSQADAQMLERYSYWKRIQSFLNADGGIKTLDKEDIKRYGEMYGDENISYSRWLEDYGKQPIFYRYWFDYEELDDGTSQLTLSRREVEYDGFDDFKSEVRTGEPEVLYSRSFASEGEWRDFNIQLGKTPNSLSLDSEWAKGNFFGEESAWEMDITDVSIMGTTRGFKLKEYGFGKDKYDYAELLRRAAEGRVTEELRKLALAEASLASMRSRKALGSKFEDNKIAAMEDSIRQMRVRIGEHERDLAQSALLAQNAIYRGEMQTDFVDSNWSKIWGPTAPKPELWLQAFARFIKESEGVSINFGKAAGEVIESSTTAPKKVFVFGSNLAGRHGKGAALTAKEKYGAVYGQGEGLQGESYGIPTKGKNLEVLSLDEIQTYVSNFIDFARKNPDTEFELTAIGTGLAGYKAEEIAPLFAGAPDNVILPDKFKGLVESSTTTKVARVKDVDLKDPNVQYIGRAGKGQSGEFGNRFIVGKDGTLEEVLQKYDNWLANEIRTNPEYAKKVYALKGKTLACPGPEANDQCHAQSIIKAIEFLDRNPQYLGRVESSTAAPVSNVTIHSGGAKGADRAWAIAADKLGIKTKAHSFDGHNNTDWSNTPKLEERVIHSAKEIEEVHELVNQAGARLGKSARVDSWAGKLVHRNAYQVKDSEAVLCVTDGFTTLSDGTQTVGGRGTPWAAEMAKILNKPLFNFSQKDKAWFQWNYETSSWDKLDDMPPAYTEFAGIGTSTSLTKDGEKAIEDYLSQFGAE